MKCLKDLDIDYSDIDFKATGADIIAKEKRTSWLIECKGVGTGKRQTHTNNMDRLVASLV
jgi:hypothetical protein